MARLLTSGNRANVVSSENVTSSPIRSDVNVTRVQVRSVNWNQVEKQVNENTDRIISLEEKTEKLEERVSANEKTTDDLVYLVNEKMIIFSDLGE